MNEDSENARHRKLYDKTLMDDIAPMIRDRFNGIHKDGSEQTVLRSLLFRPIEISAIAAALLILVALGLLLGVSWHTQNHLQPVHNHLVEISRLQEASLYIQNVLVEHLGQQKAIEENHLTMLRSRLEAILTLDHHLDSTTPQHLQRVRQMLTTQTEHPRETLTTALEAVTDVIAAEIEEHGHLLVKVKRDTQLEFAIAALAILGFPLLTFLLLYFFRQRIRVPLNNLGTLMTLLARQEYRSVPTYQVDPLLRPLFEHYNRLVTRLAELEQDHQIRQKSLENDVRRATQALLEQQRHLANSERLASIGELAAGMAHELRNPLAGIQMSLSNLRRKLDDPDQIARLDLVSQELKRVIQLLNDMLNQVRQAPEPVIEINLTTHVEQLLSLVRYQIPRTIRLVQTIPADLRCRLPAGRLRQVLLNLILNAAESLGEQVGTITVSATREADILYLQVSDDGPGFSPELLQQGVRAFVTWGDNGTGLGLAMVRRFSQDQGGDLRLANRTPRGACVTLKLPCGDAYD